MNSVFSRRFHTYIRYNVSDMSYYDDGHIGIVHGFGSQDSRGYYLTFVDGEYDDSETEVA